MCIFYFDYLVDDVCVLGAVKMRSMSNTKLSEKYREIDESRCGSKFLRSFFLFLFLLDFV